MTLTPEQEEHVCQQIEQHQHDKYEIDIELDERATLAGFVVHPGVLRPDVMTAVQFARYLHTHPEHYTGKVAIDMGCGSGIQGIVMAMGGASQVYLTDIMDAAVTNSRENVANYDLSDICKVRQGHLFENVPERADVITFNHPFFHGWPFSEFPVSHAMLDPGPLLQCFLHDAKHHLVPGGYLLHPFFHFAGEGNNPAVHGPKHGYDVHELKQQEVDTGLQQGTFSIYQLIPR